MAHFSHRALRGYIGSLIVLVAPFSFAHAQITESATSTAADPAQIQAEMNAQVNAILDTYRSQIPTPQAIQASGIERSILLKANPETPGAHESVSFTLTSALTDLDRATIAWYQNGILKESGKGKKTFSATTGDFGTTLSISAVVSTAEGVSATRRLSFKPLDIEISWEADTYTPPFYKGKALPSAQSTLRLSARVVGSTSNQSTFTYRWKKDGVALQALSGYGKSLITLEKAVAPSGTILEVSVYGSDGSFIGKEQMTVRPISPLVLFYEDRPLEGIRYQSALGGSMIAASNEFIVRTEPFFVSRADRENGKILYRWSFDGAPVKTTAGGSTALVGEYGSNRLTIINTTSQKSDVLVGFEMTNTANALQAGKRALTLILSGGAITNAPF